MKRAATDSAVPVGSMPVAAADACMYAESTDARLVAAIQISTSMAPDRHNDSAMITAIWVLPHAPSQLRRALGEGRARYERHGRAGDERVPIPRAVSGLSV